ncbi:hypothetical protein [Alicyclobacillus fructus]|uniref:hypothetical protein n=1 Tax=Alicyclobacillus fructus TaxID=2816082 RepID=UPI002E2E0C65|nr:hypothetical protein [Alicyclobacillus fructus]
MSNDAPPANRIAVNGSGTGQWTAARLSAKRAFAFLGTPQWTPSRVTQAISPVFVGDIGFAALNGQTTSAILKTADGRWKVVANLTGQVLALGFSSDRVGAVITEQQGEMNAGSTSVPITYRILQTKDGGASWRVVWQLRTRAVDGVDPETPSIAMFGTVGYATVHGELLRTSDAGSTWSKVPLAQTVFDAAATSPTDLWLSEAAPRSGASAGSPSPVDLVHSTDGGKTFRTLVRTPAMLPWEANVAVSASGTGVWLVKDAGSWETRVWWTTDAGRSWQTVVPPAYQGRVAQSVPVISGDTAYIGLCPYAAPFPGGVTSFDLRTGKVSTLAVIPSWYAVALAHAPNGTWYAAPSSSQPTGLYQSAAGFTDWRRVAPVSPPDVQVVADPALGSSATPALVGVDQDGFQGAVEVSADGGASWRVMARLPGQLPIAVAAGPGKSLVVASVHALPNGDVKLHLWVSRDGGSHWRDLGAGSLPDGLTQDLTPGACAVALSMRQGTYTLAIGAYPQNVVLTSSDGLHWQVRSSTPNAAVLSQPVFDQGALWWLEEQVSRPGSKKGNQSVPPLERPILVDEAGAKPKQLLLPEGYDALAMAWSGKNGWVFCTSAAQMDPAKRLTLWVTHDGGSTWTSRDLVTPPGAVRPEQIQSLSMVGGAFGALLTDCGLLVTRDGGWVWRYAGT